jgi:pheromone a factor receptor
MCEILFTTPLAIFNIWLNASLSPIGPWISWDDTHFDYGRVIQVPATIWRSNRILAISIETTRWVAPLCAFIFFMFFGLADEAKKNYKLAFHWVMKRVCRRLPSLPIALRRRKFSGFVYILFSNFFSLF